MTQAFDVSALVEDLTPVRSLAMRSALTAVGLAFALAIAAIVLGRGLRADLLAGNVNAMFLIRGGLLLLLGSGCGWAVLRMARPAVGKNGQAWKMAIAASALLPLSALVLLMDGRGDVAMSHVREGIQCMMYSGIAALGTAVPMVVWLRRGAPTAPARAAWLTGVAAGGLGTFAYGLYCPFNDPVYIGCYYSLAVAMCSVVGRLVVPPLIRW